MPAYHAQRRPVVVANARYSPLWLRFAPRPDAFRARCLVAPEKLSASESGTLGLEFFNQAAQLAPDLNQLIRFGALRSSRPGKQLMYLTR